jgi:C-1 hydroxylase
MAAAAAETGRTGKAESHPMSEANKNVIRRYLEAWNAGDLSALMAFWAPNLVHHTRFGAQDYEDTQRIVSAIMQSFPDMRFRIDDMIAEGDKVATRMSWSGTHIGEYMGASPTGRKVSCALIGVARIEAGKIAEHWGVTDELHMMQQMGLLPEALLTAMA